MNFWVFIILVSLSFVGTRAYADRQTIHTARQEIRGLPKTEQIARLKEMATELGTIFEELESDPVNHGNLTVGRQLDLLKRAMEIAEVIPPYPGKGEYPARVLPKSIKSAFYHAEIAGMVTGIGYTIATLTSGPRPDHNILAFVAGAAVTAAGEILPSAIQAIRDAVAEHIDTTHPEVWEPFWEQFDKRPQVVHLGFTTGFGPQDQSRRRDWLLEQISILGTAITNSTIRPKEVPQRGIEKCVEVLEVSPQLEPVKPIADPLPSKSAQIATSEPSPYSSGGFLNPTEVEIEDSSPTLRSQQNPDLSIQTRHR